MIVCSQNEDSFDKYHQHGIKAEGVHYKYTIDKYTPSTPLTRMCPDVYEVTMYLLRANSLNLSKANGKKCVYVCTSNDALNEWNERKKIAKHTNHRDKSWSVNPVAYEKCEKILKKSMEIRIEDEKQQKQKKKKAEKCWRRRRRCCCCCCCYCRLRCSHWRWWLQRPRQQRWNQTKKWGK